MSRLLRLVFDEPGRSRPDVSLWRRELDDKLRPLLYVVELGRVEVPTVAAGVDEAPAVIGRAINPRLNGIGRLERDRGGTRGDLPEGETVLLLRRLQSVGRHACHEAVPRRGALPRHQHPV